MTRLLRRRLAEDVVDHVKRLVVAGELRAGDALPVNEITAALRVSRAPLREALLVLEQEGWVTLRPSRRAVVNAFDRRAVEDEYGILGLAMGLAVQRAMARDACALGARLAPLLDEPVAFHLAVLDGTASPFLARRIRTLSAPVPEALVAAAVPAAEEASRRWREVLLDDVGRGDGAGAAATYASLMAHRCQVAMAALRSG